MQIPLQGVFHFRVYVNSTRIWWEVNDSEYWLRGSRVVFWMRDEKAGMSLVLFLKKNHKTVAFVAEEIAFDVTCSVLNGRFCYPRRWLPAWVSSQSSVCGTATTLGGEKQGRHFSHNKVSPFGELAHLKIRWVLVVRLEWLILWVWFPAFPHKGEGSSQVQITTYRKKIKATNTVFVINILPFPPFELLQLIVNKPPLFPTDLFSLELYNPLWSISSMQPQVR